jgi:hypothetical protein
MNTLEAWVEAVRAELGIVDPIDRDQLLDVTRDVAHAVARPAAPLTAYLMGIAVGSGKPADECATRILRLCAKWPEPGADLG